MRVSQHHINKLLKNCDLQTTILFNQVLVVSAKFDNGYIITVHTSSIDPENFDEPLLFEDCIAKITSRLYELEEYKNRKEVN